MIKFNKTHQEALRSKVCAKDLAQQLADMGLLQGWTEAPAPDTTCRLALNSKGKVWAELPLEDLEYTPFGDIARQRIGMQCQYACRYILGEGGSPTLGEGLRFQNWPNAIGNYHSIMIHRDDVDEFVNRVLTHRRDAGII